MELETQGFTERKWLFFGFFFFFFPLELKHGKPNPTPPEDLQTDVAFPAHPQLLSPSQPLVAYKEQLIPSKGRKPVSLLHAVITSQRVFKLFVFSIASFNLALASKCKIAKQLLAFHVGYSQTLLGSQATGWSRSGHHTAEPGEAGQRRCRDALVKGVEGFAKTSG